MSLLLKAGRKKSKSYKKTLHMIPFIFTFGNAFFGFISVIFALQANSSMAAACLGMAACMDAFDGRLARAFGSTSCLGAELDALCDAISFCFAPAILVYHLLAVQLPTVFVIIPAFYLCAGLFRLARFNTIVSCSSNFVGLPTTAAAFFLATLIYYKKWVELSCFSWLITPAGLLTVLMILAFLMVSTIRFPSLKKISLKFPSCYIVAVLALCSLLLCYCYDLPVFLLLLTGYIMVGIFNFFHDCAKYLREIIA